METCPFDPFEGIREVNQPSCGRHRQNAQRACYPKTSVSRDAHAFAVIHQDQVGVEFDRTGNGIFLPRIETVHGNVMDVYRLVNFCP